MRTARSSYYPPRAGLKSRVLTPFHGLRRTAAALRSARRAAASRIGWLNGLPRMGWRRLLVAALVPGAGFWFRGPTRVARAAFWAAGICLLVFIVFLGSPIANLAFTALLGLHATGLVYFLEPWMGATRLLGRILFSIGVLIALTVLIYNPLREFVEQNALTPIRVGSRAVVVGQVRHKEILHRGEVIAYRTEETSGHGYYIQGGVGLGPILAMAGDKVEFFPNCFTVNGMNRARLAHMPDHGSLTVPEKHWFVWPEVSKQNHVALSAPVTDALLGLSVISEEQILGKAFKRWFFRNQSNK